MDAALFSAHDANTPRAAVEGETELPDGSTLIWGLSRKEFGPMSFRNRPEWSNIEKSILNSPNLTMSARREKKKLPVREN